MRGAAADAAIAGAQAAATVSTARTAAAGRRGWWPGLVEVSAGPGRSL